MTRVFLTLILSVLAFQEIAIADVERLEEVINAVAHRSEPEGSGLHDEYLYLMKHGSKEVIPYLIEDLRYVDEITKVLKKKRKKKRRIECTWVHLRDALESQTGESFGFDRSSWESWWEEKGKYLPEKHFNPQKNKTDENHLIESIGASAADS